MGGVGGVQTLRLHSPGYDLFLFLRYTDKLFLPEFFLLASGCLRGFLLLGCRSADGLLAGRLWKPPTVPAQGNGDFFTCHLFALEMWEPWPREAGPSLATQITYGQPGLNSDCTTAAL